MNRSNKELIADLQSTIKNLKNIQKTRQDLINESKSNNTHQSSQLKNK
jgi:hypothetical protein